MRTQQIGIIVFILSSAALTFAQGGPPTGIQKNGGIQLLRSETKISVIPSMPPVEGTTDNVAGAFVISDYTNYTPPTLPPTTTIGPCIVTSIQLPLTKQPPDGIVTTYLDAGPVLNINGPNGPMQIAQKTPTAGVLSYFMQVGGGIAIPTPFPIPGLPPVLPPYLDPGTYTVDNGGGGADVGPFSVTLNVPSPGFVWTNADANLTITRSAGVDLQWSGGDPSTMVEIQGTAVTPTVAGGFTCIVPNNGEFVVTSDVLSLLPATPASATPATNLLTVTNFSTVNFSATGIDTGILLYISGSTRPVVYQ
jgi:hypothetical protein